MTDGILFLAAFAAAAISGAAGFGGALVLLPVLIATVGVSEAVPLLTFAQLIGNLSRAVFGFRQIRWKPVALFLLGAVPCAMLGAQSFFIWPKTVVMHCIGGAILFFVMLRCFKRIHIPTGVPWLIYGGGLTGFLSGLVGSAGPLGAAVFLALGLPPVAYVSSEAATALAMHGVKMLVYGAHLDFSAEFWRLAVLMSVAMVAGTWVTKRLIERIPRRTFQTGVGVLLVLMAVYMILRV